MPQEFVIGDHNWQDHIEPVVDGEVKSHGLVPRNYRTHPHGCYAFAPAFDLPLIPKSEWSARIKEMEAEKSRLSDIRLSGMPDGSMIPSRDQNGKGYCWAHSSTSACLILRALNHDVYADLSAYMVACIIKGYKDQGGWGAESMEFIMKNGVPTSQFWPQKSMSRANDNPVMRENAKKHIVQTAWMDIKPRAFDSVATCLLNRIPVVVDYNWWSHSICALDLVETSPGAFGVRIWNSWGDSWSDKGMGILAGSKAVPDGAVAPRVIDASVA